MKVTVTAVAASLLTCQGAIAAQQAESPEEMERAEGIPTTPHQEEAASTAQQAESPEEMERAEGIPTTPHQEEAAREVEGDLFTQLDEDGNGLISRQEAQAVATLSDNWSQYDQDADGALDSTEFSQFAQTTDAQHEVAQAGEQRRAAEELPTTPHQEQAVEGDLVRLLDRDGDGLVSQEEAQAEEQLADNWGQYDANDDGQLDAWELDQFEQELRDTEEAE